MKHATKTPTIFLKRNCAETCINNYNTQLLKCWRVNIDLQYVTSPYAAIAYITSFITKDEREVGTVLHYVNHELKDLRINEPMRKVAYAFSNARNVSAQEAAYRILSLPLHKFNFTTVWFPSGFPENRIRIVKPKEQLNALHDEDENVFAPNIIDRFAARPRKMCDITLAEFVVVCLMNKYHSKNQCPDTDYQSPEENREDE